jgi:hypothetical protein
MAKKVITTPICYSCEGNAEFRDIVDGKIVDVCKKCIKTGLLK